MTLYHQPMHSFGNRLMKERRWYAKGNVSEGDAHSWNGLGVVILRGNLGSCSWSWTTKSSLRGGKKGMGRKEAGGERMCVPEKWSSTHVLSSKPSVFPPSRDGHYFKWALRFGKKVWCVCVSSKYWENCCSVCKPSMEVCNWDAWWCLYLILAVKLWGA